MNRILNAARLHVVHPMAILAVPWLVVLSSFAINEAIWGFGHLGSQPGGGTGGVLALYITVAIVFVQSVTQLFPFALGMGLSRRTFYAGTAVMVVAQAIGYAVVLVALTAIENTSGGWWVGLHFFAPLQLNEKSALTQFVVYGSVMLGMAFLGVAIGVISKRWGPTGLYALGVGVLLAFGGAAVVVTALGDWAPLGHWFADRQILTLALGYAAVVGLISAGLSYLGLRRAVP
jgi:hypothetical protein